MKRFNGIHAAVLLGILSVGIALPVLAQPIPEQESSPGPEQESSPGGSQGEQIPSPGASKGKLGTGGASPSSPRVPDFTPRAQFTSEGMGGVTRRLAAINAMDNIDEAIASIKAWIAGVEKNRAAQQEKLADLKKLISDLKLAIRELTLEIKDLDTAIIASTVATAGIPNPGTASLVSIREAKKAQRRQLGKDLKGVEVSAEEPREKISRLTDLIETLKQTLISKRNEKNALTKKMAKLEITAPSEGARLRVDSEEVIRVRSINPPAKIIFVVQKDVVRGGETQDSAVSHEWKKVYERTWDWKKLPSAGGGDVSFGFKTGQQAEGQGIVVRPGLLPWFGKGDYRVQVRGIGVGAQNEGASTPNQDTDSFAPRSSWRNFSIVGKVGSEVVTKTRIGSDASTTRVLGKGVPLRPGASPQVGSDVFRKGLQPRPGGNPFQMGRNAKDPKIQKLNKPLTGSDPKIKLPPGKPVKPAAEEEESTEPRQVFDLPH